MNSTGNSSPARTIGRNNARYASRFPCYITYMNDATQTSNLSEPASTPARASVASIVLKGQTNMTIIFLAADSTDSTPICFSNLGSALDYVRDSHADLNPEGSALMFGAVPATNKAVKASHRRVLDFTAAGADAAAVVAATASKLDGAISACASLGVDPSNVAKVAELQTALEAAQALVGTEVDSVSFTITVAPLHKRGYKRN
jgi:hypothetical protein